MNALLIGALLAAEEEEPREGIDLLLPESSELIAGIIAFSIIFFVVWKFALPKLKETLEARQAAITGQLQEAEGAKQEAQSLLSDYQQQVAGAREESGTIIDEARQTAEALRADIVAKAEADADEIRSKARRDAEAEMGRAQSSLRSEVASLSMDVAEKVIGSSLDRDGQSALVDRYIDELQGVEGN
ncbi:MAG: F0F1 ATP synthase subunit B [Acidimicrobiia bacterium]|nr:F0F1 ATP synthase subunit B [Acidimicrobiia bacterium]